MSDTAFFEEVGYFDVCIFCAMWEEAGAVIKIFKEQDGAEFGSKFDKNNRNYLN